MTAPTRELVTVYGGAIQEHRDPDGVRYLTLPSALPESRARLLQRAVRWTNPTVYRWLLRLPVYRTTVPVVLSRDYVVHLPGDGTPFACGTQPGIDDAGVPQDLRAALAVAIDAQGKEHKPRPCRACFARGLLVVGWEEEQEDGIVALPERA